MCCNKQFERLQDNGTYHTMIVSFLSILAYLSTVSNRTQVEHFFKIIHFIIIYDRYMAMNIEYKRMIDITGRMTGSGDNTKTNGWNRILSDM
jgi:hypothetical protein